MSGTAEMCFLSQVHFLYMCVCACVCASACGFGCPPVAARGMFVVDCLQAPSQTQYLGKAVLNWCLK